MNDWRTQAACRGKGIDLFFATKDDFTKNDEAKSVCATCPVVDECREWALAHEKFGTWGGMTETRRRKDRSRLRIPLVRPETGWDQSRSVCGSSGGAQAHRRRGEPVCEACREAHARDQNPEQRKAGRRLSA